MAFPNTELRIASPEDLQRVLREAKQCIADGTLRQINLAPSQNPFSNITDLPVEGPWPDYIEMYFEDLARQKYRLVVETYHGAGGEWSRQP